VTGRPVAVFDLFGTLATMAVTDPLPPPPEVLAAVRCDAETAQGLLLDLYEALTADAFDPAPRQPHSRAAAARFLARGGAYGTPDDWVEVAWHALGGDGEPFLRVAPLASDLLDAAADAGAATAILSNTQLPGDLIRRALAATGLLDRFDVVTLSSETGWRKPGPAAFAYVEGALAARTGPLGERVMVGDDADLDLAPAAALGYRTLCVDATASDPGLVTRLTGLLGGRDG
jgi:FMN phosphatase YigB (HAD superfamily)